MKKTLSFVALIFALSSVTFAQENEGKEKMSVPSAVKTALKQKYPEAKNVGWEKEKGNYEANWGGKSGEDNSVQFTPSGNFIEIVKAIPMSQLPASTVSYIKSHYKTTKFGDIGKVLDAKGKTSYEVEINRKDVIFDDKGSFVKTE
jgi:hypothetical protein